MCYQFSALVLLYVHDITKSYYHLTNYTRQISR